MQYSFESVSFEYAKVEALALAFTAVKGYYSTASIFYAYFHKIINSWM